MWTKPRRGDGGERAVDFDAQRGEQSHPRAHDARRAQPRAATSFSRAPAYLISRSPHKKQEGVGMTAPPAARRVCRQGRGGGGGVSWNVGTCHYRTI
jgi:hypothetical protein